MNGRGLRTPGTRGEVMIDDNVYIIFNADNEDHEFTLPPDKYGNQWTKIIDTAFSLLHDDGGEMMAAGERVLVQGRSVVLLKQPKFLVEA